MATPSSGPSSPAASGGLIPTEWPAQAADTIVETIDKVRDKTTKPALTIARALVYGTLALMAGMLGLVLGLLFVGRLYNNYSPVGAWLLYTILAAIFLPVGLVALRRANKAPAPTT